MEIEQTHRSRDEEVGSLNRTDTGEKPKSPQSRNRHRKTRRNRLR